MKNNTPPTRDIMGYTNTYEIVDHIPAGFFVWNIGENMGHEEYIPICEPLYPGLPKSNPDSYHINPETVKAIKLAKEEVAILRDAAGYGVTSKKAAKSAIKRTAFRISSACFLRIIPSSVSVTFLEPFVPRIKSSFPNSFSIALSCVESAGCGKCRDSAALTMLCFLATARKYWSTRNSISRTLFFLKFVYSV